MEDHPNLSPQLNAIMQRGSDPGQTLDLKTLKPAQTVSLVFSDGKDKKIIEVKIEVASSPDPFKRSVIGKVVHTDYPEHWELNSTVELVGSCTDNPHAPMGMTMMHAGAATIARNIIIAIDGKMRWLRNDLLYSFEVKG